MIEGGIEKIVETYIKPIHRFVLMYVKNNDYAEEIVQEIFIKVWKNLHKFDKTKPIKPWLFRIAKNCIFDWFRKKKNDPILYSSFFDSYDKDSDEHLDNIEKETEEYSDESFDKDRLSLAQEILSKLSPKDREIIHLYFFENLNFREISEILEQSINTVKSRHRRALIMIREGYNKPD